MPNRYEKDGLSFQFPENWQLDEDPAGEIPRSISITSEDGAFWALTVYPPDVSLDQLSQQYLDTLGKEYEDLEQEDLDVAIGDQTLPATDLQFYCLDFLVHSRVIARSIAGLSVLICWQAEDREFDKLEPIFQALTFSLLQSSTAGATST